MIKERERVGEREGAMQKAVESVLPSASVHSLFSSYLLGCRWGGVGWDGVGWGGVGGAEWGGVGGVVGGAWWVVGLGLGWGRPGGGCCWVGWGDLKI